MNNLNLDTIIVHAGSEPDINTGAVVPPISLATTFSQSDLGGKLKGTEDLNSFGKGYEYQRTGNPTRGSFERAIASCEKGKYGIAFSSGSAATASIIQTLKTGSHVISIDDVYGGTQRQFRKIMNPCCGIEFDFIDMGKVEILSDKIKSNTKLIWIETPTNPTLKITDINNISNYVKLIMKRDDIIIAVDNTFATPYFQNPLDLGADLVVHSVTKYIGGHSDVVMGCIVCNNKKLYDKLRFVQNSVGAVPSPFDCYMALRGLKTLHIRMEKSQQNSIKIANFLSSSEYVEKCIYPGLESHPNHEIAKKQMNSFGSMVTFFVKGGLKETSAFLKNIKIFTLAESLGAVESLAECPAIMTHASVPEEDRKKLGISDNLVRLSIGIENCDDLIKDLQSSLEKINT
jgi:cystathionine gamma-lyase